MPRKFLTYLRCSSSESRVILNGMVWIAIFLATAKLIVAGKEVVLAHRYGTSAFLDGYLFVLNMSLLLPNVFASIVNIVIIPLFVKLEIEKPEEGINLRAALLSCSLLLGLVVSILFGAALWWIINTNSFGLTITSGSAALMALPWLLPTIPLSFMCVIFSGWLMSQRRQANTFLESLPSLSVLVTLLFWPKNSGESLNILPLSIATLAGYFLQTFFLQQVCTRGAVFAHLGVMVKYWPRIRKNFFVVIFAQLLHQSTGLIDQYFNLHLGEGVLSSYSYAQRVVGLLLGLTSVIVTRATLPVFSEIIDCRKSFYLSKRWGWLFSGIGLFLVVSIHFSSEMLATWIFQRGEFTLQNARDVAQIIDVLTLHLPFYLFGIVTLQWLASVGFASRILMPVVISFAAKVVGLYLWSGYGATGVAASTVFMYVVSSIALQIEAIGVMKKLK